MKEIEEVFLEWAKALHRENPAADAHFDLASEVYERRLSGERDVVERYYLPHFRQAGLRVLVSSVYIASRDLPELGLRKALGQITALREDIEPISGEIGVVTSARELEEALKNGKIAVLLSLEGLDPLGNDLSLLRTFYDLGVRGAGLTWSRRNAFATGCCKAGEFREIPGGLTELGFAAVERMEALGMYLDVSHLNNEGFQDVCACAKRPFIASHSNAWRIHPNYRNLTDEQIGEIAGRGGLIGLNACALLTGMGASKADSSDKPAHEGCGAAFARLCEHAEYLAEKAGASQVCFGFDLCRGLEAATPRIHFETEHYDVLAHHGEMVELSAMLLSRGMSEEKVIGMMGGNFIRYLKEMLA